MNLEIGEIMLSSSEELSKSLKATAAARFNAAKRLSHVDKRLTLLTAFSSSIVIILTVWPNFVQVSESVRPWVGLLTVALSIILLVSSLLQYASNHAVKAELFHRSALEIQDLFRRLKCEKDDISDIKLKEMLDNYDFSLQKYSINHEDVDYFRYLIEFKNNNELNIFSIVKMRLFIFLSYNYPTIILISILFSLFYLAYKMLNFPIV